MNGYARKPLWQLTWLLAIGISLLLSTNSARADDIVDNIDVTVGDDYADIRVNLAIAAKYVRHFPLDAGQIVEVYLQPVSLQGVALPTRNEAHRPHAPESVPCFSISFTPLNQPLSPRGTFPLIVRFDRPMEFRITGGQDDHGFSLRIPLLTNAERSTKPRRCAD